MIGAIVCLLVAIIVKEVLGPLALWTYNRHIFNLYFDNDILEHFIENPVKDLTLSVPAYFQCKDFRFPDLKEAVNIQMTGRLKRRENVVLNYTMDWHEGEADRFERGLYSNSSLFVKMLLSNQNAIYIDGGKSYAELYYELESIDSNDLPFFITQLMADYCFNNELSHYTEDKFIKVFFNQGSRFNIVHEDMLKLPLVQQLLLGTKPEIVLDLVLIGSQRYSWDIDGAILELTPMLQSMSSLFNFSYRVQGRVVQENDQPKKHFIDDKFPTELTDLPGLSKFYRESLGDSPNMVHLILYPFDLAKDKIHDKTVDSKHIYSEKENSYLTIADWGCIYFTHSPVDNHFCPSQLKDCMMSFMETLMDFMKCPNDNMAPYLRLEMFKRILIVNYLTYFSDLLYVVRDKMEKYTDGLISGREIDTLISLLEDRQDVIDLVKNDKLDKALIICKAMISKFDTQLKSYDARREFYKLLIKHQAQIKND